MSSSSRVWGSASALTTASPSRSGKLGSGLTTGVAEPAGSFTRLLQGGVEGSGAGWTLLTAAAG